MPLGENSRLQSLLPQLLSEMGLEPYSPEKRLFIHEEGNPNYGNPVEVGSSLPEGTVVGFYSGSRGIYAAVYDESKADADALTFLRVGEQDALAYKSREIWSS